MSIWQVRKLGLLLCLLAPLAAQAGNGSDAVPGIRDMRFRNYSVMQGLPQATAGTIAQDSTGYFWIGTQDGLARFDGYEFKVYKHDRADTGSLSDNFINAIVAGDDGGLWIATRSGGLNRFQPWRDRFKHWRAAPGQAGSLASNNISALVMGAGQRLWIANEQGRLQWIDPGSDRVHDSSLGQRSALTNVRVMRTRTDGSVLAGGLHGLVQVDKVGKSMAVFGPPGLDVYALALGADGTVWVGTASDGLYHLAEKGQLIAHYTHRQDAHASTLPDNEIRSLLIDHKGVLWIAGNSTGLASLEPASGRFRHFPHRASDRQSVAANRLWTLHEGRHGLILIGSWTNGFSIHDPATELFTQIYSVPGDDRTLPAAPAKTVFGARDGSLWAGIIEGGGLVQLDMTRGVIKRYVNDASDPDSLANNFVQYVTQAKRGGLWVATVGGGLDRLRADGSGFDHLRHDPDDSGSLASDSVLHVLEDSHGTLWVATKDQGLDERCAVCSRFRHHMHVTSDPHSLSSNIVSSILETRAGDLWIGTRNGGLDRLDRKSGHFEHFTADPDNESSLSAKSISSLFEDSRGRLWVGTQGGALNMQVPSKDGTMQFKTIDHRNGLDSDAIGGILEDARGQIWVSTIKGISRIDPTTGRAVNYSGHDGASQLGYWVNSATYLNDGRLVFGGLSGITVFNPIRLPAPRQAAPVLTDMRLEGKPFRQEMRSPVEHATQGPAHKRVITLRHDQNDVSFEFSALEYANPEAIQYGYQLQGHDPAWVTVSWRRRIATYTSLAPGLYTLRLRARSGHGDWSAAAARLSFRILDPPWRTPLAYIAYALLALLFVCAVGWRVHRNVSRRRQVQETIRDSEARLKMALWGSGTELWDIDMANGHMYRENRLPDLAISTAELSKAPADILAYMHPDDRSRFRQALVAHLKQEAGIFEASYRTLGRNKHWIWVLSRGQVVKRNDQGRALRISGISSDINALKQAEEALRVLNENLENRVEQRTQELHARNTELRQALEELTETQHKLLEAEKLAALGGLVAGVAHEINTPLGVALTASSYLRDESRRLAKMLESSDLDEDHIQRFGRKAGNSADIIMRNLQTANRLIKSFKQVAVAQSSDDIAVVDLCECLEQIIVTLGPMVKKSPHSIELDCAPEVRVRISPGALYQIVTNLVTNAMLHGFDGATPGTIRIHARQRGTQACLRFSDDGKGMSKEVVARLYEPFFTTRRGQGGSGLGLPIVYNLVTQVLNGSIEVRSNPGQGSEFMIRFPIGKV